MTTLETVVRMIGAFGMWAAIIMWWFIGRDMNRRLNRAEDQIGTLARVATRARMLPDPSGYDADEDPAA